MDVIIQALKVTFNLRSLHVVHPFRDFLCDLRVGGSEYGGNMRPNIAVFPKDLDIFLLGEDVQLGGELDLILESGT
jgi:hypothetical protein